MHKLAHKRVLVKFSGESVAGNDEHGIDPQVLNKMASSVKECIEIGAQIGVVIGGGNLFRGEKLNHAGMDRVAGDHMGMLATVMNALAMRDALERASIATRVMSAIPMSGVVEHYDRRRAIRHLEESNVVIFSAGTGNPFFTTDSAACLRGIEVDADIVLKATKVDGVYSSDPVLDKTATRYNHLTYDEVLEKQLGVMDLTAICLARDHDMPLRVFAMEQTGALLNVVVGENEGTLISNNL